MNELVHWKMSDTVTATHATITIGPLSVDGFMLPDGSYWMSQTQVAECINENSINAVDFLESKTLKALRGEGYTPQTFEVSLEKHSKGKIPIQGWSLDIVYAFWVDRYHKGNRDAFKLIVALGKEPLERRFDNVFGVERSENKDNNLLVDRLQRLSQDLERMSETYAIDDDIRNENTSR